VVAAGVVAATTEVDAVETEEIGKRTRASRGAWFAFGNMYGPPPATV